MKKICNTIFYCSLLSLVLIVINSYTYDFLSSFLGKLLGNTIPLILIIYSIVSIIVSIIKKIKSMIIILILILFVNIIELFIYGIYLSKGIHVLGELVSVVHGMT
jgi:hypothetical protein